MNFFIVLSWEVRLALLFLLGVIVGTQVNRGIYRLAWFPRRIGPWSPPPDAAPPRRWFDRIPIFGWWTLRRESAIHGRGFWIRPALIELAMGLGIAWLYAWVVEGGLVPPAFARMAAAQPAVTHAQFFAQAVLISLMAVATFIDFDEQTIPDAITIPGTLIGLLLAALLPQSLLPIITARGVDTLWVCSPMPWPRDLYGPKTLVWGLLCLAGWCLAILPRTWTLRRGWIKAFQYLAASVVRHNAWMIVLGIFLVGAAGIVATWWVSGVWWRGLFSSLVGMAFGGGLIWSVRVVGSSALGREAMGFGDVTLMSMIGAFVGWQPALLIFFLAPIAALFISLTQWLTTGRKDIAFGPYLCFATLILILGWSPIWAWGSGMFYLGWFIPGLLSVCLVLMWGMLTLWRMLGDWVSGR